VRKADNLPPSCAVVTKSGSLNFLEPSGPVQARSGTDLPSLYDGKRLLKCNAGKFYYSEGLDILAFLQGLSVYIILFSLLSHRINEIINRNSSNNPQSSCLHRASMTNTILSN